MKIKRQKKGFTIVELVIVIAVIGVLAAVLIPTFAGLVRKAHVAADTALVKDLNTVLATDKALNGKHMTMQDALDATKESGLDVSKLNAKVAKNEIMWDSANDVFCYLDDGEIKYVPDTELEVKAKNVKAYQYFVIRDVDSADDISTEYSTYLRSSTLAEITTTKGFDAGEATTITKVTYTNTGDAQNVVIRTNSATTNVVVNAPKDTVNHYGNASVVDVQKVDMNCYNENGKTAYVKVTEGKVVVKNGGQIEVVFTNNTDVSKAVVTKENGGEVEQGYTIATSSGSSNITLTQKTETEVEEIAKEAIDKVIEEEDLSSGENANARFWIDIAADEFAGGTGTENNPYLISSARELALVAEIMAGYNKEKLYSDYCDKYYKLTRDIDLAGKIWISIGTGNNGSSTTPFKGHFDGNNKTISNMSSLDATYEELANHKMGTWSTELGPTVAQNGFIGYAQGVTVKDLNIVGASFNNAKYEKAGFIVCCSDTELTLENCHVDSTSKFIGKSNIGGLVGLINSGSLTMKDCSSAAKIEVSNRGAGFIGSIYCPVESKAIFVENCTFSGSIKGDKIGGFIGRSSRSINNDFTGIHFKNCHMLGDLINPYNDNTTWYKGIVEGWQADSTTFFTFDNCTYKDFETGNIMNFELTTENICGYLDSINIKSWFGVDGVLNDYPTQYTENNDYVIADFSAETYSIDFTNQTISYTLSENGHIMLKHTVYDFSRVTFVGQEGVELIIRNSGNHSWSVEGNTQFYEEDGETLFTDMTYDEQAGIYILITKFVWNSTNNSWKLIDKNFVYQVAA